MDGAGAVRCKQDEGFTLIELLVAMSLAGIVMTLGILAMHGYLLSQRESGTVSDVRSTLRMANERALSEGKTYCVYFTSTQWSLYRTDCTVAGDKVNGPWRVQDTSITLSSISFPAPNPAVANQTTSCPVTGACAYFYPRGTALAGSLRVVRASDSHPVTVEGLTGRVTAS
jgi:prepilin-type N-terminal cleavage/methylation domain-containing protein